MLLSRRSGRTSIRVNIHSVLKLTKYYLFASIDNYTELCTIEVDLSHLPLSPRPKHSGNGNFYDVDFDIVLLFGLTEFKAAIAWKENVGLPMVHKIYFIKSPVRVLNDGVQRGSYMIQTTPNLLSTLSNFPP